MFSVSELVVNGGCWHTHVPSCHAHFWRRTWRRSVEIGTEQSPTQIILRWNQFWWDHPNLPCYGHGERVELCPNNISQKLSQLCWGALPYYPHIAWLLFLKSPHPHSLEFVTVAILQKTEMKKYAISTWPVAHIIPPRLESHSQSHSSAKTTWKKRCQQFGSCLFCVPWSHVHGST